MQSTGLFIRELRQNLDITITEMAKKMGTSTTIVCYIELEKYQISTGMAKRLLDFFDGRVPPEKLATLEELLEKTKKCATRSNLNNAEPTRFGKFIRDLRTQFGVTHVRMASKLNIGLSYLRLIELGETPLTQSIANKTIKFFESYGVSENVLQQLKQVCDETVEADRKFSELMKTIGKKIKRNPQLPPAVLDWLNEG